MIVVNVTRDQHETEHGWPLNSDSWEAQMVFLASRGYRCIAHDRRGHGRSSQPWNGNDMEPSPQ
jgi:non-heme chloroperoxidase